MISCMRIATDLKESMFRGRILEDKNMELRELYNGQSASNEGHAFAAKTVG